jgi:hypothetical protein
MRREIDAYLRRAGVPAGVLTIPEEGNAAEDASGRGADPSAMGRPAVLSASGHEKLTYP